MFCDDKEHTHAINSLYEELVQSCVTARNEALSHTHPSGRTLPFWNEIAEPYKQKSLIWHWLWVDCGRPCNGNVALS